MPRHAHLNQLDHAVAQITSEEDWTRLVVQADVPVYVTLASSASSASALPLPLLRMTWSPIRVFHIIFFYFII